MTTVLPHSRRGPACPPAAVLEALSAGEPVPAEVSAHAAACPDCAAQLAALREAAAAFVKARPPELFLRQVERRAAAESAARPGWLRRLAPTLALAIPLALVVTVAPRLLSHPPPADDGVAFGPREPGHHEQAQHDGDQRDVQRYPRGEQLATARAPAQPSPWHASDRRWPRSP